ncbi:MAG: hypothetical protein ABUK01_07355 [Leptospirales bacterium]
MRKTGNKTFFFHSTITCVAIIFLLIPCRVNAVDQSFVTPVRNGLGLSLGMPIAMGPWSQFSTVGFSIALDITRNPFALNPYISAGLLVSHLYMPATTVLDNGVSVKLKTAANPAIAYALFRFPKMGNFQINMGAGSGITWVRMDITGKLDASFSSFDFTAMGRIGLSWAAFKNRPGILLTLNFDYFHIFETIDGQILDIRLGALWAY